MKTSEFDYVLPKKFIAQNPVVPRDHSKLMVYDTERDRIFVRRFFDIGEFLRSGDTLVLNRSKVINARIVFHGKEIFLLKKLGRLKYQVMVRPGKFFKTGVKFTPGKGVQCGVLKILEDGTRIIDSSGSLENMGITPLPPYITKTVAKPSQYQTVYAREEGSVAAPTAGLHFTKVLLGRLKREGVKIEEIVLHVGRGTFLPVATKNVEEHKMHREYFEFSSTAARRLNLVRQNHGRVIAVGTTSARVLESCFSCGFGPRIGETDIFIYPGGHRWLAVDALITNFHLPKSTLIMLVAAFLESKGIKNPVAKILELYEFAKRENFRFYSFGDVMFII